MTKINKISRWAIPMAMLLLPLLVFAQFVPQPVTPGQAVTLGEVENVIRGIARFLVVISIIIAVIFIVWGGIMWMASRGDEDMAGRAKKTIINGIIGALVVLGVGVILQTLAAIVTRTFFGPFMG